MRAPGDAATIAAMTTDYALARSPGEYARLRAQARAWEPATARLFDHIGVPRGARCLDAGCGPGETMRLLAQRVGPQGHVLGLDVDAPLGTDAINALHAAGHRQTAFAPFDLTSDEPIPGGPFDVVFARLLLYHLPQRIDVLERLWEAVAPNGYLAIQDYDVRACEALPPLETMDELRRIAHGAFEAAGCDVSVGARLPQLFARARIGTPDGTDVTGRLEPLKEAQRFLKSLHAGLLDRAIAEDLTTAEDAAKWRNALNQEAARFPDRPVLWPLMISAWKRKPV
jgi:SAM-dependent methyltransferase